MVGRPRAGAVDSVSVDSVRGGQQAARHETTPTLGSVCSA